jgi:hypothetical protein
METLKKIIVQMNEGTFAKVKKSIIADYSLNELLLLLSYRETWNENLPEIFNCEEDYLEVLKIDLYIIIQRILLEPEPLLSYNLAGSIDL